MPVLLALLAGVVGWGLWTRRITAAQLPPVALGVAGAFLLLRGQPIMGIIAIAIAAPWFRGISWRLFGKRSKQSPEYALAAARWTLGVTALDDAETIRARHRKLIAENHPDTGGSAERAKQLNEARDILLNHITKNGL